ncbi:MULTISPECIES: histidinol-phosphate transaminase [unclassified Corynebacterium]|uniref:histidinol-phosphate transaminase n=1 Tax=unclassified Corynebacterium TaxID=2624378 RepID=UPI0030AD9A05
MTSPDAQNTAPHIRPDLDAIAAYVPGKTVPGALKLASNEMAHAPLPQVTDAIAQTISTPETSINRYPDMGTVALRNELASHLGLPADNITIGCGSSALCLQLVQITAGPGDEVIFPWRSFEAYPILTRITGATPVAIPLNSEFRNDLDAMVDAITEHTRLIFVCNPNNPTGTTVTREEFESFMARVPAHIVVALDEAYIELADDTTRGTMLHSEEIVAKYPNLVGLRTFSKVYGLAGLRVGYAFGDTRVIEALNKVCIPFSVNTLAQVAATESLRAGDELRERIASVQEQRVRVTTAINVAAGAEIVVPDSQANFVWIPEERVASLGAALGDDRLQTSVDLAAALADKKVLVRCFAGEGVRITVTTAEESDQLLAALGV